MLTTAMIMEVVMFTIFSSLLALSYSDRPAPQTGSNAAVAQGLAINQIIEASDWYGLAKPRAKILLLIQSLVERNSNTSWKIIP